MRLIAAGIRKRRGVRSQTRIRWSPARALRDFGPPASKWWSGLAQRNRANSTSVFFSRMVRGVPWVRMKVAASLDGKTALDNGISQWITSATRKSRWPCLARARLCLVDRHRHGSR
jgi:hypothetical protein